jgi:hypothetical protein
MTAAELLRAAREAGEGFQGPVNEFVDEFRRASAEERQEMIVAPLPGPGTVEGLVAAVVSALCRETETPVPAWVGETYSPEPYFAFPARSFELRLRLLLEAPAAFRIRNVFVPESYLSRA